MPEGDTVWLTAHRLHAALAGRVLTVADLRVPALATVDLCGMGVLEVVPRGKHVLTRLDAGLTLHSHLRMDGSWHISPVASRARAHPEHMIRVLLGNQTWLATGYRIHDLELVPTTDEAGLVGHLGPDLLGPDWDAVEAERRLRLEPSRPIAEALIDQRNLAGIGNLYKSETLFMEGVHPWQPVAEVAGLNAVITTAHRLLHANRDHPEQSTTGLTRRGQEHWVYQRGGQPCRRCRAPIMRQLQGDPGRERSTYWCPRCQPAVEGGP
jgi:endonuclease-8